MGTGIACLVIWSSLTPVEALWRFGPIPVFSAVGAWSGKRWPGTAHKVIAWAFVASLGILMAYLVIWTPTKPVEALTTVGVAVAVVAALFWVFTRAIEGAITLWCRLRRGRGTSIHKRVVAEAPASAMERRLTEEQPERLI